VPEGDEGEEALEPSDAECYRQGDTHGGLAAAFPDLSSAFYPNSCPA
jgi:hypothetical protein